MSKIEYAAGIRQKPLSKREEQIQRIMELADDKPEPVPMYECAAGTDHHGSSATMMEILAAIPPGRQNAVSKRKFCKQYAVETRIMDEWIARAGQHCVWICEQRGKIWKAVSEADMELVFKREREHITYR